MRILLFLLSMSSVLIFNSCAEKEMAPEPKDPYLWLEEVEGDKALKWVGEQNKVTLNEMTKSKRYKSLEKSALTLLQSKDKIPYVSQRGKYLYNFWQDAKHVRGLWRRTTLKSYKRKNPRWETVLDLDKLAKAEKENWVLKTTNCLPPEYTRCLVELSRGGKDAVVVREFDVNTKKFVKDGFYIKEAKNWIAWKDKDHLFVARDFGKGTVTESGYGRIVKIWKRGTDLSQAKTVLEGQVKDVGVYGATFFTPEASVSVLRQLTTFFSSKDSLLEKGKAYPIPTQESAALSGYFKGYFVYSLRDDWSVAGKDFKKGSLVGVSKASVLSGKMAKNDVQLIFEPDNQSSVLRTALLKDQIVINVLNNVQGNMYSVGMKDGMFNKAQKMNLLTNGHMTLLRGTFFAFNTSSYTNDFFFNYEGFLTPKSFYRYNG
ncbi:MAG: hypothetical protein MJK18_16015, partial [Bdellovibrionales bacterium]|nr:hypothetical protein [Bdellovibrionales bacterium]